MVVVVKTCVKIFDLPSKNKAILLRLNHKYFFRFYDSAYRYGAQVFSTIQLKFGHFLHMMLVKDKKAEEKNP